MSITGPWWSVVSDAWRTRLWPLPGLGVALAVGLGIGLPRLDAHLADDLPPGVTGYLFSGGPEAARTVLSVLASSLITVTSLTFSLTVVTLQLASSQFSPRLLRTFTRDRVVHLILALLLATFIYAITVLRTVRASLDSQAAFVPQLSVTVAYVLGVGSVLGLVLFLAHLARQIRVESMLQQVHTDTTATIHRVLTGAPEDTHEPPPAPSPRAVVLCAASSGFLTWVDESALLAAAADADAVIRLHRLPGEWLVAGTPMAVAWPRVGDPAWNEQGLDRLRTRAADAVHVGSERTAAQDVAFGLRQLVDVAVKALSPGINDPTTAVHALGHISSLLCEYAAVHLGPRVVCDGESHVRVIMHRPDLETLLSLSVDQPRRYGAGEPAVLERLLALLQELAWSTVRPDHHRAIAGQLERIRRTATEGRLDPTERRDLEASARSVEEALAGLWSWAPPGPEPG